MSSTLLPTIHQQKILDLVSKFSLRAFPKLKTEVNDLQRFAKRKGDKTMKFFVDTAEIDQIKELNDLGMVDGVTTNPSLIKKSGRDIIEVTKDKTSNHSSRTKMSLLTPIDSLKPKARIML